MPQVNERRAGRDGAAVPRSARRLAWALLGVTVTLLAAGPVIGLTGGESWSAVFGFIPVALAFAVVGALVAARTGNRAVQPAAQAGPAAGGPAVQPGPLPARWNRPTCPSGSAAPAETVSPCAGTGSRTGARRVP
jgi:hypothetical protein